MLTLNKYNYADITYNYYNTDIIYIIMIIFHN